ncbi:hypothetical protein AVDCRST_MAG94-1040 [uncultured Leptolyngbya sp.]|uniref:Uncharacterized protein n=1 Tax=uncultured Leptolyngbya sp. TaxID=332963 RepID=A0A6J4KRK5_9CYAN|nr:hypothetical protein AVDCRST_MAG94-1040 [uncultured Leptolyngbya sp.]
MPEIVLLNVRWYGRYALSERALEAMMCSSGSGGRPFDDQSLGAERRTGTGQTHSTAPEADQRRVARGRDR